MACLRGSSTQGCIGTVQCDEEGCEFRRITAWRGSLLTTVEPSPNCVLQLRLRIGPIEEVGDDIQRQLDLAKYGPDDIDYRIKYDAQHAGHVVEDQRPNVVYLDEYQRWIGTWEAVEDDFGVRAVRVDKEIEPDAVRGEN